jgi:hypothetical protein
VRRLRPLLCAYACVWQFVEKKSKMRTATENAIALVYALIRSAHRSSFRFAFCVSSLCGPSEFGGPFGLKGRAVASGRADGPPLSPSVLFSLSLSVSRSVSFGCDDCFLRHHNKLRYEWSFVDTQTLSSTQRASTGRKRGFDRPFFERVHNTNTQQKQRNGRDSSSSIAMARLGS